MDYVLQDSFPIVLRGWRKIKLSNPLNYEVFAKLEAALIVTGEHAKARVKIVLIALFSSRNPRGLGTRIEGLWRRICLPHRI